MALCWLAAVGMSARAEHAAPNFSEVRDIIHAHLQGITDAELNRDAVMGLVSVLAPKVSLVSRDPGEVAGAQTNGSRISRTSVLDDSILYVRVVCVEDGLADALRSACQPPGGAGVHQGLVLDLRFAGGGGYAAAAAASELFVKGGRPLMDWGAGMVSAKQPSETIGLPVAVLVNRKTAGAAEALAAVLRTAAGALVLGAKTAGEAMMSQEYALANGDCLRIATKPVQIGDGSSLSDGVDPDILVRVGVSEERAFYDDAIKTSRTGDVALGSRPGLIEDTNTVRRPRMNEKELVREHREELNGDSDTPRRLSPPPQTAGADRERPQVRDPALARAVDLLKGLAVVRAGRS